MKNEKGVTLIILLITVAIMTILAATAVNVGTNVLQTTRLENFSYELQEVQGKVDTIYEKIKLGDESYITLRK